MTPAGTALRFPFASDWRFRWAARWQHRTEANATVSIVRRDGDVARLQICFGPWHLTSPLTNLAGVTRAKHLPVSRALLPATIGPRDRSATFATTTRRAVRLKFDNPVYLVNPELPPRIEQVREVVVTVEHASGLVEMLEDELAARPRRGVVRGVTEGELALSLRTTH